MPFVNTSFEVIGTLGECVSKKLNFKILGKFNRLNLAKNDEISSFMTEY